MSSITFPTQPGIQAQPRQPIRIDAHACPVDVWLLGLVGGLLLFGLVMVASASFEIGMERYGDPFGMIKRQSVHLALALGAAGLALSVPVVVWQRLAWLLLLLVLASLVLLLVPGLGETANGATRWLMLGGFSLQSSEYAKLFMACYVAACMARLKDKPKVSPANLVKPLAALLALVLLLLWQPDLGTSVIIAFAMLGVIFLAGAPWRFFLPLACLATVGAILLTLLQPYRVDRLLAFRNPWQDHLDSGYQLTHALIAFGRGEWLGLGLGNSIQKLDFLPEAHTDFIFSIIGEELGVVGALLVIAAFTALTLRMFAIGIQAKRQGLDFHAYLAYGLALLLGIQALVNIGVNLGALPTKGLTLPFISYGGNSLIVSCVMVAILLRIGLETREQGLKKLNGRASASLGTSLNGRSMAHG